MGIEVFRRLTRLGKRAGDVSAVVGSTVTETLGVKAALGVPIGIDFGVGSLKILQIVGTDTLSLVAAASLETPPELISDHAQRLQFQIEALPRLIRKGGFRGRRASCAIPGWQTMCRQFQFPKTDGIPVSDLVAGALSQQLNVPAEALAFRHIEVRSPQLASNRAEVICIATARDLVERLMRALQDSKLQPVGIHSEFSAILRAFDYVNRRADDGDRATLYLDIGAGVTKALIGHGRDLVFARVIDFGGRRMDEHIARQLKVEMDDAHEQRIALDEQMSLAHVNGAVAAKAAASAAASAVASESAKIEAARARIGHDGKKIDESDEETLVAELEERRTGMPHPHFSEDMRISDSKEFVPPKADLTELLEVFTDELQMCLRHYATQYPGKRVERAVFVGGEARGRGLCAHIARALKIPAQMADPMARVGRNGQEPVVGVDLRLAQPGWALALGLCLSPTDL